MMPRGTCSRAFRGVSLALLLIAGPAGAGDAGPALRVDAGAAPSTPAPTTIPVPLPTVIEKAGGSAPAVAPGVPRWVETDSDAELIANIELLETLEMLESFWFFIELWDGDEPAPEADPALPSAPGGGR